MIFINPQWQGSGQVALKQGAETLSEYFKGHNPLAVPLSEANSKTVNDIKFYAPLLEQLNSFKEAIVKANPTKIFTLGGDCGIEVIPISYLNQRYNGDLGVVWIDAHADMNTPQSSPSKDFHGMPLRTLLGEGDETFVKTSFSTLSPDQVFFVGLKELDPPEKKFIEEQKIAILPDSKYSTLHEKVGRFGHVYIHLDLDVLAQSEFPHTLFPREDGLSVKEVAHLIGELKTNCNVVGICITESTATNLAQLDAIKTILDQVAL